MSYFFWGLIALFIATAIFYIVFALIINYWHERRPTLVVVPVLFTFEFFLVAFIVVCLVFLFFQYLPDIGKLGATS